MSQIIEVKVPDIGDFKDVPIIDIAVKVGDTVAAEDALLTLESDKATIDVPSPAGGVIKEITVKTGDKVSQGSLIARIETAEEAAAGESAPSPAAPQPAPQAAAPAPAQAAAPSSAAAAGKQTVVMASAAETRTAACDRRRCARDWRLVLLSAGFWWR